MDASIRTCDDVVRILGVNPHRVKIAMNTFYALRRERLSAVLGVIHRCAQHPNPQIVIGIHPHLAVVGRAWIRVAHFLPCLALVFAAVDAAFFVLHQRVNDIRILAIDIQPDTSCVAAVFIGQALRQFLPGCAAVRRLINRSVRSSTVETIRCPPPLIRCGVERIWALRVHGDVDHARILINFQHLRPRFPAIRRFVNASLRVRSPQMP